MKFLSIYKTRETNQPPSPEHMARMQQLVEDSFKSGVLVATEGCLPTALGARVRQTDGNVFVTDGPFTEAKEVVAGFAILNVRSKEHAIEETRKFLAIAGDGECELRQVFETSDCSGASVAEEYARLATQD